MRSGDAQSEGQAEQVDMWVYDGQLQRWATETLTETQRREVDRLTGQAKALRKTVAAAVALAGELKAVTIESLLRMGDAERGLFDLWRGAVGPFGPVTTEQEKLAGEIDAWVQGLEARGGSDHAPAVRAPSGPFPAGEAVGAAGRWDRLGPDQTQPDSPAIDGAERLADDMGQQLCPQFGAWAARAEERADV